MTGDCVQTVTRPRSVKIKTKNMLIHDLIFSSMRFGFYYSAPPKEQQQKTIRLHKVEPGV